MEAEVIVVGAGPAGATTARELAAAGHEVILVDKAEHPREKICGGWVNRRVPEMFPWVGREALERPFYGIVFYSDDLARKAACHGGEIRGYLVDRARFDAMLVDEAIKAGARFARSECSGADPDGTLSFADGSRGKARVVVGADGVAGKVAAAGIYPGFKNEQLVICASQDFKATEDELDGFYGAARSIYISLAYSFVSGYAWVFPAKDHVSVGVAGRLHNTSNIALTFKRFVKDAISAGLIPAGFKAVFPRSALEPAGAALGLPAFSRGRLILVGDAGGFVSAASGEGIFPAMWSGKLAASVVHKALGSSDPAPLLGSFDALWRREMLGYLKPSTGKLPLMIDNLFQDPAMAGRFAAAFLDGKGLG